MRLIGIRSVSPAIVLATCSMCLLLAVQLEAQAEVPAMKLEWTWNVSEHPEFAQANLYGVTLGAVVADDIDADGDYEILWAFRKAEDRVMCLNARTHALEWVYSPMDEDPFDGGDPWGIASIEDIDGDGVKEILIIARTHPRGWVKVYLPLEN